MVRVQEGGRICLSSTKMADIFAFVRLLPKINEKKEPSVNEGSFLLVKRLFFQIFTGFLINALSR